MSTATMTAPVVDVTAPEVVAAMAAAARHAAVPVKSTTEGAAAPADDETLTEWAARLLKSGTADDAMADVVRGERMADDAAAIIAAATGRLTEWVRFAQSAHADGMDGKTWKSTTRTTGQEYGRLRSAGDLFDAYAKRGVSFGITMVEAKRLADSKGVTKVATMVAEIAKRVDPIDVRAFRKSGKRIPGNAAIVAGSLAPAAPAVTETPAETPADETPADETPAESNRGTEVAHDETPDTGATTVPAGSTDTGTVVTLPLNSTEWVTMVEMMGARAHLVAAGKRNALRDAAAALILALDTLDGVPTE